MLLVEGLPRWDFRFLKNALRRDNGVGGRTAPEVDVRLSASAEYARFDMGEYDADIVYGLPRQEGLVVLPLSSKTNTSAVVKRG